MQRGGGRACESDISAWTTVGLLRREEEQQCSARWTVEPEERASAFAKTYAANFHIKQDKDGGGHFDFHGVYEDEMIKTPEG